MPACYCTYIGCNGQFVDNKTKQKHKRYDASEAYHNHSDRNANTASVAIRVQENLQPKPQGTVPESLGPAPRNQTSIAAIPESVAKMLWSLAELRHKAELQSIAWHNLKSRALASSSPSKSLLEEIKTHHIGMETTHAVLIALWCRGSSVAMRVKEELRSKLQSNIEDIKHLRDTLTNAACT